ncbi:MAG: DAK2 domain-containing protein, partial [Clostridia bacterium]|nr:DAK2 domain-containing protein [Clostridia bacterium]
MIHQIDGQHYKKLIDYGIRNLSIHKDYVNDLNVFPVPDGDTGTNMALTLQNGFAVIAEYDLSLREAAAKFAKAVVYGARGNSGVITSQFFKGFSEQLATADTADVHVLAEALDAGVKCAYGAVAQPVEGTILTVMREATEAVVANVSSGEIQSVDELISVMLAQAESTLAHTPELLPVLKSAGVVDSGGAGFVFVLQGMKKY